MSIHAECLVLQERAERVLAGGPATLSKLPSRYPQGIAPAFLAYGEDAYVTCPDGYAYLDTVAALGPIIVGHNDPEIALEVMEQAGLIMSGTLGTRLEVEVAEMLCSLVPGAEAVRFACNGKDVTEAAIRVARYVTGRRHVIYCGYSGGYPDYLITTDKHGGVLEEISAYNHQVPWRDFEALEDALEGSQGDLAALILEVPPEHQGISIEDTTRTIRRYGDAVHMSSGVFILDEVVTGLRYGLGGAQQYYSVEADLITMSKALGNGAPVAAIMGRRDLMDAFEGGRVFLSTTFGANALGLAAARATLRILQKPAKLANLRQRGQDCIDGISLALDQYASVPVRLRGNFARFVFDFASISGVATTEELRTLWLQELCKQGILAGVPWFSMTCWNDKVTHKIINAVEGALSILDEVASGRQAIQELLEVPIIADVFQRYARQNW